jgi:hypothetical protein
MINDTVDNEQRNSFKTPMCPKKESSIADQTGKQKETKV